MLGSGFAVGKQGIDDYGSAFRAPPPHNVLEIVQNQMDI